MRQTQQHELYAAERKTDRGRRFNSLEEITTWANALRDQWWWFRWYPMVHVIEVNRSKDRTASVGEWIANENLAIIAMQPVHMNEHDVLHELAHPLTAARFDEHSHGPHFARVLLELTYLVRGTEAYQELEAAFRNDGIVVDDSPDDSRLHGIAL